MNSIIKMDNEEEFEERAQRFLAITSDFALKRALSAKPRSWVDIAHAFHPFTLTAAEEAKVAEVGDDLTQLHPQFRKRDGLAKEASALKRLYQETHHAV